ncbi:hypothetical protein [Desulfovirgula thermocuniculi]|uniref:hypothetical protein n=1 Tax=Desulfovirgula thermocuniculi TaxID=348842 RepID=UPI00042A2E40|nr:hypothetical protein [Desulfovirgula thermocuniculi]
MRAEAFFSGLSAGFACFGGGLWLVLDEHARQGLPLPDDERRAAALLLTLAASFLLAGFPAGVAAEEVARRVEAPALVLAPTLGGLLAPALAWFAGLEPAWPACWAWAWGLAFAGSWAGMAAGTMLAGRKRR